MNRQFRRRMKRKWDKAKCFIPYFVDVGEDPLDYIPHTAVDYKVKVDDDMLFRFNLSMFKRWRVFVYYVDDGIPVKLGFADAGVASDEWLDEHFGESDEDFEL